MNTALLVIDAQQSFTQRTHWIDSEAAPYMQAQQALIDGVHRLGRPVVQIFHHDDDVEFQLDSGFVRTLDGLQITPEAIFHKTRHSALVGTGLDVWLRQRGINHLIVSGIRTEQCCETTTRHASDLGFKVDYVTEATHTFAMQHAASGECFDVAAIKRRSELVLAGRFAHIHTVSSVLNALAASQREVLA
ncbi:Peroxyureidoacrylate/ureidoacrylate amidohydrolase RutB [Ephemeroptericola cinctiostellae]|uniref:Peroxyureidoacrylate/ureidoacrylate amidohydrolase RutB n=1 Tax=Ephemeroptericola cinctiostellae TaxID=2268024 RepID=A0A345DED0_9BURK|nr:isochorismatase family protein [Ephemeroptericola cinctiostellae]AXF86718.1 Peroxyureidoacrylate/ureidoacrylate amidohydrolase RutB [Ephemeroptericola cinctiostellae]